MGNLMKVDDRVRYHVYVEALPSEVFSNSWIGIAEGFGVKVSKDRQATRELAVSNAMRELAYRLNKVAGQQYFSEKKRKW